MTGHHRYSVVKGVNLFFLLSNCAVRVSNPLNLQVKVGMETSQRLTHSTLHIPIEEIIEEVFDCVLRYCAYVCCVNVAVMQVRKELEGGVQLVKYPLIGSPKKRSFRLVENHLHWVRGGREREGECLQACSSVS